MRLDSPICDITTSLHARASRVTHLVVRTALVVRKGLAAKALVAVALATTVAGTACAGTVSATDATARPSATIHYTPVPTVEPTLAPTTAAPSPTATLTPDWTSVPAVANDADGLARQLAMAEAAIRDPKVTGAQLAYMGHLQQLAYGQLADFPDWRPKVLAALPEDQREAVKKGLEAGDQLRTMHGSVPTKLPDWKIVAPAPVDDLLSYYKEAQETFGVEWQYLAAIHLVETRMGRIRGLSTAGAQGPMQFIPSTWAMYGKGDINDNHDAILAAARYLKAAGAPGNMQKALFAYNHSQAYVNALMDYADVMKANELALRGYYGWQVYYPTVDGVIYMPVGWVKPS